MSHVASGRRPDELGPQCGPENEGRETAALWIVVLMGSGLLAVAAAIAETPAGPVSTTVVGLGTLAVAVAGFLAGRTSPGSVGPANAPLDTSPLERALGAGRSPAASLGALSAALTGELERSRRYDHSFTLVKIDIALWLSIEPSVRSLRRLHRASSATAARLRAELRSVDQVWAVHHEVYVLMPECDRAQADRALGRLGWLDSFDWIDPGFGCRAHIRMAAFPTDGITNAALLRALRRPDRRRTENRLEPAAGDS
jgi:hypothetical protein